MSVYDELLHVQEHDTAIDRLRHRRAALPARAELAEVDDKLAALQVQIDEFTGKRAEAQRSQSRVEDELEGVEAKAAEIEKRMYSGTVTIPRELQAMHADVESLRRRRSDLEEQVLDAMSVTDGLDDELRRLAGQRDELDGHGSRLRALIAEEEAAIDGELAAESEAREQQAKGIPADLVELYEQLRTRLDGIGAARLVNGRCSGCHLTLPATEIDRIRKEPPEALIRCDQCSRVLVRS